MIVFLNGRFVPESKAVVSVFDRGFLFGDGLWEAMLVTGGKPFCWAEHLRRLQQGIDVLKLAQPYSNEQLHGFALELIRRNGVNEALLRINISRGITERGYSPRNARNPAVVMTLHPAAVVDPRKPARWSAITSSMRLPAGDPLALFKTANKLQHVMARAEADAAGVNDAILLNTGGRIAEATSSNVFWVKNKVVHTSALPAGPLPGVTRSLVLGLCRKLGIDTRETLARPAVLHQADGVFLTMTSLGIVELKSLDGKKLKCSPLTQKLFLAYRELLNGALLEMEVASRPAAKLGKFKP